MHKIYLYKFFAWFHMFSAVIVLFFTGWAKITVFQLMLLESWCMFCMMVLEIPTGGIADFFGRKYSMQMGLVIQALGFAVYVSVQNFYIYMLGEAIIALGLSLISGAEEAFIYDTIKNFGMESESKKVFGRAESFGLAGIMIASPLGSIIAKKMGLNYPMLFMFIPLTIAFIFLCFLKEPVVLTHGEKKNSYIKIIKVGMKAFYEHKILKILAVDLVVIMNMGFLMIWLYQLMLKEAKVDILFFGLVNTSTIIIEILLLSNYSRLEKILKSKKRLMFISAVVIGIMYIVGGLTKAVPVVIVVILVVVSLSMTRRTLMVNYMNKFIRSEERATVLSSVSMLVSVAKMISFPLIGFVVEKFSLSAALIILGSITIVFAVTSRVEEAHLID